MPLVYCSTEALQTLDEQKDRTCAALFALLIFSHWIYSLFKQRLTDTDDGDLSHRLDGRCSAESIGEEGNTVQITVE